jgi:ATP-dependent exoDNAse (exonuclease V) beta subunit
MPLKVLKSSAGSGKTYALVREYLRLALSSGTQPGYYRHILAITFTNAAAGEMKERVLSALNAMGSEAPTDRRTASMLIDLALDLGISQEEVRARALGVHDHMLHHYSSITISTIDSFSHRLVRSFARDLFISHDFEVEMDLKRHLGQVTDALFELVGKDKGLTDYVLDFVESRLEDETKWDVREMVTHFGEKMFREEGRLIIAATRGMDQRAITELQKKNKRALWNLRDQLVTFAKEPLRVALHAGLDVGDFYYSKSGIWGWWNKCCGGTYEWPNSYAQKTMEEDKWTPAKAHADTVAKIESVKVQLSIASQQLLQFIRQHTGEMLLRKALDIQLSMMGLMSKLYELSEKVKQQENIRLISDFQELIGKVVSESPAPFIYERVGERYNHILFDEFQDTSALQWRNFVPLLENSLSRGHMNLIVGDGKQSIYRWRDGRAEQFVRLPEIVLDDVAPWTQQVFLQQYQGHILPNNFRSAKAIVEFNNALYPILAELSPVSEAVYKDMQQQPVTAKDGYVEVVIDSDKAMGSEDSSTIEKYITECVHRCVNDGFLPGDIGILLRTTKEIGRVSALLMAAGYAVVNEESFLLENHVVVRLLMASLDMAGHPESDESKVMFMVAIASTHTPTFQVLGDYLQRLPGKKPDVHGFLKDHFAHFRIPDAGEVTPDQYIDQLLFMNQIQEDSYTECLFGHVHSLVHQASQGYVAIVRWWKENKSNLYVPSSERSDAVRLMTVHKSKGLEFDVVIYPRFKSKAMNGNVWVVLEEEKYGIGGVPFKVKSKAENFEPEEVETERQHSWLDDLNLCYVATTRAVERLYVYIETSLENPVSGWDLSARLKQSLAGSTLSDRWEKTWGETIRHRKEQRKKESVQFMPDPVVRANSMGAIRPVDVPEENSKRNIGRHLHAMLARIRSSSELHHLRLSAEDHEWLSSVVDSSLLHPWFDGKNVVLNEQELYHPVLGWMRPDRILLLEHEVWVLDFKTGQPASSHHDQVRSYCLLTEQVFGKRAKGFLYYTVSAELAEVASVG